MNKLKHWWTERRRHTARKHWEVGFCWAAGQLFLGQETTRSILKKCAKTLVYIDVDDPFDQGAIAAVKLLRERGLF